MMLALTMVPTVIGAFVGMSMSFAFMALTLLFQTWFAIQKLRGRKVPEEERIEDRMRD